MVTEEHCRKIVSTIIQWLSRLKQELSLQQAEEMCFDSL